jgi:hypothetical protein
MHCSGSGWSTSARTPRELLKAILSGDVIKMNQRTRLLNEIFDEDIMRVSNRYRIIILLDIPKKKDFQLLKIF